MSSVSRLARRWRRDRFAGATAAAVVALGVAASSALFAVYYVLALGPLPYPEASQLFVIRDHHPDRPAETRVAPGRFLDFRDRLSAGASLAAAWPGHAFNVRDAEGTARQSGAAVTATLLDVLARRVVAGRNFVAADMRPDAPPVVLVSEALWRARLGAREELAGTSLLLDGRPHEVVGVVPGDVALPFEAADVWIPLRFTIWNRVSRSFVVIGRRAAGLEEAVLSETVADAGRALASAHPDTDEGWRPSVTGLGVALGESARRPVQLVLIGAVVVNMLVALNLGLFFVARVTAWRHELAVRRALGASTRSVATMLLADVAPVVVIGAVAGLVMAWLVATPLAAAIAHAGGGPLLGSMAASGWPTVTAAALSTLFIGTLAAFAPAIVLARIAPVETLRVRHATTGRRARQGLVVAEVAGALILVTMAADVTGRIRQLQAADIGFHPEGVFTARVALPVATHDAAARRMVAERFVERVAGLPGVRAAAVGSALAFGGSPAPFTLEFDDGRRHRAEHRSVTDDYFVALGIPVLAGRTFDTGDRSGTERVAVVSEALARRLTGGEARPVIGRRLSIDGPDGPWRRIVGVVGDTRYEALSRDGAGELYQPWSQEPWPRAVLFARSEPATALAAGAVAEALRGVDSGLALYDVVPLADRVAASLRIPRLAGRGLGLFSVLAVFLVVLGVSALVAWSIEVRHLEFAIRTALGASPARLVRQVGREVVWLVGAGVLLGLPFNWLSARAVAAIVPGFGAPAPLMLTTLALAAGVVLAAAPMLGRVTRCDPARAMRGV